MHSSLAEAAFKYRIALVGAPNAGKTTLFNWLTDSNYETVNYPGATVETNLGSIAEKWGGDLEIYDTPGTYSLFPKSYDEEIAVKALFEHPKFGQPALIIGTVDATQISRHLFLIKQLQQAGFTVVVALTNMDLLEAEGRSINFELLTAKLGSPVVPVYGQTGTGVAQLIDKIRETLPLASTKISKLPKWNSDKCEATYQELLNLRSAVMIDSAERSKSIKTAVSQSKKIDRWLLHPVFGLFLFCTFMAVLFSSIFWFAQPAMDFIDGSFSWLGELAAQNLPPGLFSSFIQDGVIASIGAVLVFVPQIAILFLGLSYFEDSGYLARAATLIDRPLSKLGLNGRSFVPLLAANACAIPALMAARTISGRKERLITMFIIPLMSCSARLPVYALLLAFLLVNQPAWIGGLSLAAIYILSLFVGSIAAAIANKILKIDSKSFFMLELPVYRKPVLRSVLRQTYLRTKGYITKAGPLIFILSVIIWGMTTFPQYEHEDKSERLQSSYAAVIGKVFEPIIEPMGGDWRVGVGLVSAFAAREVFVSSMAIVFNITDENEDSMQKTLLTTMHEAKNQKGEALFTPASVIGLILFFMIALQCMATVGVARREFQSTKWALIQLIVFNGVAYIVAVTAVQGLRAIGIA